MKRRLFLVLLAGLLPVALVGADQGRPSFTGTWKFVPEKSTPADIPALGTEFRISHEANALVLELPVTELVTPPGGKSQSVPAGLGEPMSFKTDGAEHVVQPLNPYWSENGRHFMNLVPGGPYRVSWAGNNLIIASSDVTPMTTFNGPDMHVEYIHRLVTTSFSMNADGTLTVVRSAERDPADKGQLVTPKRVFTSTYVKQ